jgi:small subunit ribosomal protein S11e
LIGEAPVVLILTLNLPFSDVELGDVATVGECRPLSKTVKFNVLKVSKVAGGSKKKFSKF